MSDLPREEPTPTATAITASLPALVRRGLEDRRVRYVATGVAASGIYYVYFTVGYLIAGHRIPYLLMAVIANLLTAVTSYPIYRTAVFRSSEPWLRGFARFYTVFVWGLIWSLVMLPPLVEWLHIPVLISLALAVVLLPLVSYQVNRIWVFRVRR